MLKGELKKVLGRPLVWGILLGFLVVNIAFMFLSGRENFSKNEPVCVSDYVEYRNQILENAKHMRAFSSFSKKGSFAQRNIEKTEKHFQSMPMVSVKEGPSLGIEKFFSIHTAILTIIFLLYIGYLLFVREREMGIFSLIKTTYHGKCRLCLCKLGAHGISMLLALLLMYGSNFLVLRYLYGLGDLSRSIQSVASYISCGSVLSVKEFLVFGVLLSGLLIFSIILVLDLICVITEHASKTFLSTVGIGILLLIAHLFIPFNSYMGWIKYLSPSVCLDVGEVLGKYVNVNLFSIPVTYLYLCLIMYAGMGVLAFALLLYFFCHTRKNRKETARKVLPKCHREKQYSLSLFPYELFKICKSGHVVIIFSLFILLSVFVSYRSELLFEDEDEYYYYTYMQQLAGQTSEEKEEFLKSEAKRFEKIKQQQDVFASGTGSEMTMTGFKESLLAYNGFLRAKKKGQELKKRQLSNYVYETGYVQLFSFEKGSENQLLLLVGILLLAFVLSPVFAADKEQDMDVLLYLTQNGDWERRKGKIQCAILLCGITFFVLYLPQGITFFRLYGLQGIASPVQCIGKWLRIGFRVPIWLWMVIMYTIRLAALGMISVVVLWVSNQSKSIFITIMVFVIIAVGAGIFVLV